MKRVLTLLLALLMVLSMAACGSKEDDQPGDDTQAPTVSDGKNDAQTPPDLPAGDAPQEPAGPAPEPKAASKYVLTYQGCALPANADFAPLLAYLGEPASYFEAESCAFEGLDKTYTYDAVEIVTYPEGVTIGSTPEDVTAAYGEEYDTIGQQYAYEDGDCLLSVLFQDGKAISVEYTALNDMLG